MHAEHDVDPSQFEPGLSDDQQAYEHILDMVAGRFDLSFDYRVNSWLGAFLMVPIGVTTVDASFKGVDGQFLDEFPSIHHRTEAVVGLADLNVGLNFYPMPPAIAKNTDVEVGVGVTLPTGEVEPDPFVKGAQGLKHQHLFYGTGSVNPILRLVVKQRLGKAWLVAWGQGVWSLYSGKHDYKANTVVAGGFGGSYPILAKRLSFTLQHEVFYETAARWGENVAKNSGRTDLIVSAGLMWSQPKWVALLGAKYPYKIITSGDQLEAPVLLSVDFSYRFQL